MLLISFLLSFSCLLCSFNTLQELTTIFTVVHKN